MNESEEASGAIDRSVLMGLRELQIEGEPDIISELCGLFLKHAPERIGAILEAVEKGDARGLYAAAHGLKSSSAYVGAMRLSAMSRDLEEMGRSGELDGVRVKAELLREEYIRVAAALKAEMRSALQEE
ncbi:MAG: Hpt domain-containing protein [Methanothrix sp.]|nr:Hpt domain-containing protein [Methanothrix sp.]